MSNFLENLENRRSIYALGRNVNLSEDEITAIIKKAVKLSPTAFNSQTPRVAILFGDAHEKIWEFTEAALKPLTPAEAFPNTQKKLEGFKNGFATVLFFIDTDTVTNLQDQFALYKDNFPVWAEQENGIATANVWTALAEAGIGANLQHYNPVIDEAVFKEWNFPAQWQLRSQLVIGSKEAEAGEKDFIDDETRFRVIK